MTSILPAPLLFRTSRGISLALLCAALALSASPARAAQGETHVEQSGALPNHGRVVIRSGLAWLNESAPIFQKTSAAFAKELAARGLTVVAVPPSKLEPMPKTPAPAKRPQAASPVRPPASAQNSSEIESAQKAGELGKEGKLPQLKLRGYTAPDKDADLPDSVRAVTSPDVTRALYARSQQAGRPETASFAVPGRIPEELKKDADRADYAVIIRFAAVRAWAGGPDPDTLFPGGPPGISLAAATIQGTGALGYGPPAAPSPPGQNTYGTPGGYARGYEGSAPGDFWHRDSDFYQRDYQFKHGPQPQYATPPSGLSPSGTTRRDGGGFGVAPLPGRGHGPATVGWHFLLLECFDLAPLKKGQKPVSIWQAAVRRPGDALSLESSLPKMTRAVFGRQE